MIIFPYPKSTKCYGDTVIRRAVDTWVYKMEKVTINKQKKLSQRKMLGEILTPCWRAPTGSLYCGETTPFRPSLL